MRDCNRNILAFARGGKESYPGVFSGGVLPVELQNFYTPSPCFKFCSSTVQNTVYVCGESLIEIWGCGGLGVLNLALLKGCGRRKSRDFGGLVGESRAIFLGIAGCADLIHWV